MTATTTPKTTIVAEPGRHDATVSAVVAAPVEAVWRAYTEAEHFTRWWGPAELTSRVDTWEPRPGGSWRIVQTDADGNGYAFRGVYHDVVPHERVTLTFEFEGMPGHVCLETHTLEAVPGGTKVTQHAVFQAVEDRDGMLQAGMEAHSPVAMAQLQAVAGGL